uniref:Huntingtin associated protein 1 n=1 Tax=Sarcophilus harrisii TaxID=9305 RepID=G3VRS0_SARHA
MDQPGAINKTQVINRVRKAAGCRARAMGLESRSAASWGGPSLAHLSVRTASAHPSVAPPPNLLGDVTLVLFGPRGRGDGGSGVSRNLEQPGCVLYRRDRLRENLGAAHPRAGRRLRHCDSSASLQHCIQLDTLQQKLRGLEEENQQLRLEASSIVTETCQYEDQEQQLMLDCVEQFSEVSQQVALLTEELAQKAEDQARQQEEISVLLAQIVGLQQRCREYGTEMEELQQHLTSAKESQRKLQTEMQDLQEKYAECDGLLNEAQEELKKHRLQSLPSGTVSHYNSVYSLPLDSLAAEIKGTMRKENETPSSDSRNLRRVFETVKAVNHGSRSRSGSASLHHPLPGSPPLSVAGSPTGTPPTNRHRSDASRRILLLEEASGEEEEKKVGCPGTPGSQDLAVALQQLAAWQEAQEAEAGVEKLGQDVESSSGVLTPSESLVSGSSDPPGGSIFSMGSLTYLPDKLQIVKPLEGSATLHHWQQLAQPHLAGILDPRPGVLTKDFRQLEVDVEKVYTLQDPEEDEETVGTSLAKDKAHLLCFAILPPPAAVPQRA